MKLQRSLYILLPIFVVSTSIYFLNIGKINSKIETKKQDIDQQLIKVLDTIAPKPTTINDLGLPSYYLINTSFVPQAPEKNWSQPWQDACEEAALLTVHYYYQNIKPEISQIIDDIKKVIKHEQDLGWGNSVNISELAQVGSELYSYRPDIKENPSIDDLKRSVFENKPVIVSANGKTLFKENRHFNNGGPWHHYLVVLGFDDSRQQFIVHDVGTQHGAYYRYSYNLLIEAIHDLPPDRKIEEIQTGVPRVLILVK